MKSIKLLLFLIFLVSCSNSTSVEKTERYFNPDDLGKLDVENYDDFWGLNENTDSIYVQLSTLNSNDRIIESIEFNYEEKRIEVLVYRSMDVALTDMEETINTVACVIFEGDSKLLEDKKWWYSDCIPNMIFINQWNTITRVSEYHIDYDSVKVKLLDTALKIANRIDTLSK